MMQHPNAHEKSRAGFTLVELAIVLVIIGLIVGGVLVGQDLIKAATIRAQVTDFEKYNAAATTFQGKYRGLPGDLINAKAVEFGFNTALTDAARDGSAAHGDGNGKIEGCLAGAGFTDQVGCEVLLFWVDLNKAGMINLRSKLQLTSITATSQGPYTTAQMISNGILPQGRLRDTELLHVFWDNGHNWYSAAAISTSNAGGYPSASNALTPLEARGIDEKLDDGQPLSGVVQAIAGNFVTPATAAAAGPCVINTSTPGTYIADTDAHLNTVGCAIILRTAF